MTAVLSRMLGLSSLEEAQDIVQDTLLQAATTWAYKGLPEQPSAWLYRVARNRAIDLLRREMRFREIAPHYSYLSLSSVPAGEDPFFFEHAIRDSQLQMIFACCHPAVPEEGRIALALKTLCGLSAAEIARAFLTGEETVSKRIYRAREKIRSAGIRLEMPPAAELPERLDAVLHCLYLLFNEGYNSSQQDRLIREELCEEALRLCFLLTGERRTDLPRVRALLALFCFQSSRLQARVDAEGRIILLRHQDRSRWYRPLMDKGFYYLETALTEDDLSVYHLEAAIAALHASAPSFEATDWKSIHHLYEQLYRLKPGPIVALNRAVALGYAWDKKEALEQLLCIKGLEDYYLWHSCLGEAYSGLGQMSEAELHFRHALALTPSLAEQELLKQKLATVGS